MIKHDCVSRRWLIKAFRNYFKGLNHTVTEEDIEAYLVAAPSIENKGEWKKTYLDHVAMGEKPSILYCSVCHQCITYPTNFCPNCGADMRGKDK